MTNTKTENIIDNGDGTLSYSLQQTTGIDENWAMQRQAELQARATALQNQIAFHQANI